MGEEKNAGRGAEQPPAIKEKGKGALQRRWIISGYARIGVRVVLALSLGILVLYLAGSTEEAGFSDETLFLLLLLLRYSSLLLCAFSLFAMSYSIERMVHHPGVRNAFSLLFYFIAGLIGAGFSLLYSFIIAATEGNM